MHHSCFCDSGLGLGIASLTLLALAEVAGREGACDDGASG